MGSGVSKDKCRLRIAASLLKLDCPGLRNRGFFWSACQQRQTLALSSKVQPRRRNAGTGACCLDAGALAHQLEREGDSDGLVFHDASSLRALTKISAPNSAEKRLVSILFAHFWHCRNGLSRLKSSRETTTDGLCATCALNLVTHMGLLFFPR